MLYDLPYFVRVSTVVWLCESLRFPRRIRSSERLRQKSILSRHSISGIKSCGQTRLRLLEEDIHEPRLLEDLARSRIRLVSSRNINGRRAGCSRDVFIDIQRGWVYFGRRTGGQLARNRAVNVLFRLSTGMMRRQGVHLVLMQDSALGNAA